MTLFLLVCLFSVLLGGGLLSVFRQALDIEDVLLLAPVASLSFWTLLLGVLVAGGFSAGQVAPWIYALCTVIALHWIIRGPRPARSAWLPLILPVALSLITLLPLLLHGFVNFPGGASLDGWGYVAAGQSLEDRSLGDQGWLSPENQFAATIATGRFISSAFLAFLAPLSGLHRDVQEVSGIYVAWLLFVFGSSCLFFARSHGLKGSQRWLFLAVVVISGWTLKMVSANNFDNALALSFLPALAGIVRVSIPERTGLAVLAGLMFAAAVVSYPELTPFIGVGVLLVGIQRVRLRGFSVRPALRFATILAAVVCFCLLPFIVRVVNFFWRQFSASGRPIGFRPGELFFPSLSQPGTLLASYWGLIPDFWNAPGSSLFGIYNVFAAAVSLILIAISLIGAVALIRRHEWNWPIFAAIMSAVYCMFLFHNRYNYAGYKVLLTSWFAIIYLLVIGFGVVGTRLPRLKTAMLVIGIAGLFGSFALQDYMFYLSLPVKSFQAYRDLAPLKNLAQGKPIGVIVDNTYNNIWAVHFLRNLELYLAGEYRGYMNGEEVAPAVKRSTEVNPADIRFVLTDDAHSFDSSRLFWTEGPFYLWDCERKPWLLPISATGPNGSVLARGGRFQLSPNTQIEARVLAGADSNALIIASGALDSGATGNPAPRIEITNEAAGFQAEFPVTGTTAFTIPVVAGLNRIGFQQPTEPSQKAPVLAVEIQELNPRAGGGSAMIEIQSPNGLESWYGKEPFFWMGEKDTSVVLFSQADGPARLSAIMLPGPSLADQNAATLVISVEGGRQSQRHINWGLVLFDVTLKQGMNRVLLHAEGPAKPHSGDSRTMIAGLRNLRVVPDASHR